MKWIVRQVECLLVVFVSCSTTEMGWGGGLVSVVLAARPFGDLFVSTGTGLHYRRRGHHGAHHRPSHRFFESEKRNHTHLHRHTRRRARAHTHTHTQIEGRNLVRVSPVFQLGANPLSPAKPTRYWKMWTPIGKSDTLVRVTLNVVPTRDDYLNWGFWKWARRWKLKCSGKGLQKRKSGLKSNVGFIFRLLGKIQIQNKEKEAILGQKSALGSIWFASWTAVVELHENPQGSTQIK